MPLFKDELIAIIQEQDVKHERHEEHMENLLADVIKNNNEHDWTPVKYLNVLHHSRIQRSCNKFS